MIQTMSVGLIPYTNNEQVKKMSENWTILWVILAILIVCSMIILVIQIRLSRKLRATKPWELLEQEISRQLFRLEERLAERLADSKNAQIEIEKMRNRLNELQYVQDYIQAAGSYIGHNTDQNKERYHALAVDIYSHVSDKCWLTIEKIDQAIRDNDISLARELLKQLSRNFAETRESVLSNYR